MQRFALTSAIALALAASASASTFSVSGPGGSIPDVSGTNTWNVTYGSVPLISPVTVANPVGSITKVRLAGLNHTWRGDLHIFIRNPAGTIFNVVTRPGSTGASVGDQGDYLVGTYDFVDAGGGTVSQGTTNISGGTYNIFQNTGTGIWTLGAVNGPLSAITGAAGTWTLEIRDWAAGDIGSITGWTLEGTDGSGGAPVAYCDPGVGSVMPCPCFNPPAGANRGCENSAATGGASIAASGTSSLANDTLVFQTAGQTASQLAILLQGSLINVNGAGFGQGVRCVDGVLKRLYVATSVGGGMTAPTGTDPSVSVRSASLGDTILAGQHRYYMGYYRDPIVLGGCPSNLTLNGTNTMDVTWN